MSAFEKITILLPREVLAEVVAAVRAGEYTNTSEAIRDAMRHWSRSRTVIAANDEELRRLVAEGRASGEPLDGEAALLELRERYGQLATGAND